MYETSSVKPPGGGRETADLIEKQVEPRRQKTRKLLVHIVL